MSSFDFLNKKIMKKLFVVLVLITMFLGACKKEDAFNNFLRIRNSLTTVSFTCKVGNVDFGEIKPGVTTDYKVVLEGVSTLSGDLTGTITFPDSLTVDYRFTLSLNADTTLTLTED
jgi:hypothetical protein